jgi:hypothetical protein
MIMAFMAVAGMVVIVVVAFMRVFKRGLGRFRIGGVFKGV